MAKFTWIKFNSPHFTIDIPSDWVATSPPMFQSFFYANISDKVRPNLGVAQREVGAGISLQAVVDTACKKQANEYVRLEIVDEQMLKLDFGHGYFRQYQWDIVDVKERVTQLQEYVLWKGILFSLTATCLTSDEMMQLAVIKHMVESFKLNH